MSAHQRQLVELALGVGALVGDFQARLAAGEQVDAERYLSAIKEQRRILSELKLPRSSATPKPTITDYIAAKRREQAVAPAD